MPDDDVLIGARVLLRAPRPADAPVLFASVTSDPKVTEYLSWTPHPDVDETRRVIRELFNVGDDHTWVVVLGDSGEVIGQLGYRRPQVHAAEMGYCMAVRWWGRGLMSEAVSVALRQLRQDRHPPHGLPESQPESARLPALRADDEIVPVGGGRSWFIYFASRSPSLRRCWRPR
jgi:RimJ/RimL family protein N-acetyltransferase